MRRTVLVLAAAVAGALLPALPAAAADALILSPARDALVGRTVTVEVRAFEASAVDVLVDGALKGSDTTGEPYSSGSLKYAVTIDLAGLSGQHTITAVARPSGSGTEGRDSITVTVDTTPPAVTAPSTVPNAFRAAVLTSSERMIAPSEPGGATYRSSTGTVVPASVFCADSPSATSASGCATASTSTRYLYLVPKTGLVAGERYTLTLGPGVTDLAGNRPTTTSFAVRASTVVSDEDGMTFAWRRVADSRARGGSYLVSNDPGSSVLAIAGTSRVSVVVVKGPAFGVLQLSGGSTTKRVDLYSPTVQLVQVPYDFGCGTSCFISFLNVSVTGSRNASSRGVAGAVDAVLYRKTDGSIAEYPAIQGWARAYQAGASASAVRQSSTPSSYAEVKVRTTRIDWTTVVGPDQGIADVYVDGRRVARFDNWAASRALAHRYVTVADGVHTLRIVPTGTKRAASRAARVSVERIAVR